VATTDQRKKENIFLTIIKNSWPKKWQEIKQIKVIYLLKALRKAVREMIRSDSKKKAMMIL
jgi:hypothetical protein